MTSDDVRVVLAAHLRLLHDRWPTVPPVELARDIKVGEASAEEHVSAVVELLRGKKGLN